MKTLNKIIDKLNTYKEEAEASAAAWQSVTIEKKKNGEEFQKIAQAVNGAKFGKYYPVEDAAHPYLTIITKTKSGKYISTQIPAFFYLDELPKDDDRRAAYAPQLFRQTTPKTAEELREAIKNEIKNCAERAADYSEQIKKAKKAYTQYKKAIEAAKIQLLKNTTTARSAGTIYKTSLYYEIVDAIK